MPSVTIETVLSNGEPLYKVEGKTFGVLADATWAARVSLLAKLATQAYPLLDPGVVAAKTLLDRERSIRLMGLR